jgi:hypothetical protein
MVTFDAVDTERRPPSSDTPRCAVCDEAGLPRYGNYCFRHAVMAVSVGLVRPTAGA